MEDDRGLEFFERLDLTEYEQTALRELLSLGRTTAPDLAEATGIPKARIYGVLDTLADAGYVKVIPGRPKIYQPKSPAEISNRAVENRRQRYERQRQEIENAREEFVDTFEPLYQQASDEITPTEELFYVVDVGDPSETETRTLYRVATESVDVITKGFDYFDDVEAALADALDVGVSVRVLFMHPSLLDDDDRSRQADIVERLQTDYPEVRFRFSEQQQPIRGTIGDPSLDYDSGKAVLLVGGHDVPVARRQAAITENGAFVAGLQQYVDLLWDHQSVEPNDI
ncbi:MULTISPECIES: TrmB family transcriptional regulator [Salinibaculum]|uniref:TrmB family transcriptional regulator n=1 Tax=Salinibaculum TaxID=2732368 RepID=UPI0030D207F9